MTNPHPPRVCGGVALDELGLTGAEPHTMCKNAPYKKAFYPFWDPKVPRYPRTDPPILQLYIYI